VESTDIHGSQSEHASSLIPGLPDDVAVRCLAWLPRAHHLKARAVSRRWRSFFHSYECFRARDALGVVDFEEVWLHDFVVTEGLAGPIAREPPIGDDERSSSDRRRDGRKSFLNKMFHMCR
jgi:hypothetical protein